MSLWLRKLHTRDLVQPLPRPVVLPERLSTDAIALSGICRASTRTRSTVSPVALQRCWPERFFLTLRAEWSPPCQRITRSSALSSTRTTISSISVRTIRLRVSGATPALDQARSRSTPSVISRSLSAGVRSTAGEAVSPSSSVSRLRTTASRSFHRFSSSAATRRLSGSTASYWRRASLTSSQGTAAHRVLAVGVVRNQAEVPLMVRPAQITLMMVRDQHLPILALLLEAANHLLAAGLDADAAAGAPECIRAGIDWVGQNVQDRVVDRQLPLDQAAFGAIGDGGQRNALVSEPEVHLTHRLHLGELGEDERDRLADAPIRVLLDAVVADPHVADGDRHEQLAPARLLLQRFERALAQYRQLHFAHGALHAEQ